MRQAGVVVVTKSRPVIVTRTGWGRDHTLNQVIHQVWALYRSYRYKKGAASSVALTPDSRHDDLEEGEERTHLSPGPQSDLQATELGECVCVHVYI